MNLTKHWSKSYWPSAGFCWLGLTDEGSSVICLRHIFLSTGAPHGSELLYLFGPTVYRQEIGVGFQSRTDEEVADMLKRFWLEFARGGWVLIFVIDCFTVSLQKTADSSISVWKCSRDPTPSPFGFKWEPSTREGIKNFEIGSNAKMARVGYPRHKLAFWNDYLHTLVRATRGEVDPFNTNIKPYDSKYRTGESSSSNSR